MFDTILKLIPRKKLAGMLFQLVHRATKRDLEGEIRTILERRVSARERILLAVDFELLANDLRAGQTGRVAARLADMLGRFRL